MEHKYEVTVQGRVFGAGTWRALALGIAAAFNVSALAAGGEKAEEAETSELRSDRQAEACPTFVLRADQPGHLLALMAATAALPGEGEVGSAVGTLREFELWEVACRR